MPLELGLFLGAKRALILDVERYRYQRFISDLAGIDIHGHGGDAVSALRETRDWLANVSRRILPSADRLARLFQSFTADLPTLATDLEFDPNAVPYVDFERMIVGWLLTAEPPA